jgi:sodium transport system permease protein
MTLRNIGVVYKKEMVDSLRDRRTIVSMVVVPILLMPLLTMGIGALAGFQISKVEKAVVKVAIVGRENGPSVVDKLRGTAGLILVDEPDYKSAIEKKRIQVAVSVPDSFESRLAQGFSSKISVYYDASEMKSESGANRVAAAIKEYAASLVLERLKGKGLASDFAEPVGIDRVSIASKEKMGGMLAGMFLPYLILILALTGAMYPAIDLTAGEKERGTLETLLLSAATRFELVMGKFLTVFSASFVTALLASMSMMATMKAGFGTFPGTGQEVALAISPLSLALVFFIMIPVCCFFSGVLISVSLFAKSYKEATSYLSPLITLLIIPAVVSVLPGTEMGPRISLIPIINTSLAFKEILMGTVNWNYLSIVFLVNVVLAIIALLRAVQLFNNESVLFRS